MPWIKELLLRLNSLFERSRRIYLLYYGFPRAFYLKLRELFTAVMFPVWSTGINEDGILNSSFSVLAGVQTEFETENCAVCVVIPDLSFVQSCNSWYQLKFGNRVSDASWKADVEILPPTAFFFFVFVLNIGCRCATIRTVMSYTTLTKSKRQEIGVYPNTQGTSLIGLHKLQISPQAELLLIIIFKTLLAFEFLISICSTLTRPFLTTPCRSAKTCRQGRLAF